MTSFTYGKRDKLKRRKQIEQLFAEGKSITAFPVKLIYCKMNFLDDSVVKAGVSVSKRLHKTAVARNRIKRLLREAYRLNKPTYINNCATSYGIMFLYISKDGTTFEEVDSKMKELLQRFIDKTPSNETTAS